MIQVAATPSLDNIKQQWEAELRLRLESCWCIFHKYISDIVCSNLKYFVLHLSNSRLAKLFPGTDEYCPRCKHDAGTLSHMFWACPKLEYFWEGIFGTLARVWDIQISPNPVTALFGVVPQDCRLSTTHATVVAFTILLAWWLILLKLKKTSPPSHKRWVKDLMAHLKVEQLRYTIQGSIKGFRKIWQPFLVYVENLCQMNS